MNPFFVHMPTGRWMMRVDYQHPMSRAEKKKAGIPQRARARRPWVSFSLVTEVSSVSAHVYEASPGKWRADFANAARWNLTRSSSMAARVAAETVCRALQAEHEAFWAHGTTRGAA